MDTFSDCLMKLLTLHSIAKQNPSVYVVVGVERNQNQDFLQGKEFLHIYLNRYMYREF